MKTLRFRLLSLLAVSPIVAALGLSACHHSRCTSSGCCMSAGKLASAQPNLVESSKAPATLKVESDDLVAGQPIANTFVYNTFGCQGENLSPALRWSNVPAGTRSFAVIAHDPDAPTGVGFFHWLAFNLPADTRALARGAAAALPAGAVSGHTDFGQTGYGGPCPPPGPAHRYLFTVYALDVDKLDLPAGTTGALLRFHLLAHTLALGRITGTYGRSAPAN